MCQYRHYYFPCCKHQQTVLVNYCDAATPVQRNPAPRGADNVDACAGGECGEVLGQDQGQQSSRKQQQQHDGKTEGSTRSEGTTTHPSVLASTSTTSSPTAFDLAAVAEEPILPISTSIPRQQTRSHSSPATIVMALPPFNNPFRQWMSGGSTKQSSHSTSVTEALAETVSSSPLRLAHLRPRERTDESYHMLDRNNIHEHLVDHIRESEGSQGRTDDGRTPSLASTAIASSDTQDARIVPGDYDTIEAEVDDLKKQIRKFRKSEDASRTSSKAEDRLQTDQYIVVQVDEQQRRGSTLEESSAAERLQKQHEDIERKAANVHESSTFPMPPSADDFPALGSGAVAASILRRDLARQSPCRPLHASAVTLDDIAARCTTMSNGSPSTMVSPSSSSAYVFQQAQSIPATPPYGRATCAGGPHISEDDADQYVFACQDNVVKLSSSNGKKLMEAPHFAQPTVSAVRRADETLRQASVSPQSRSAEGSPTKLAKGEASQVLQRSSKRATLPNAWTDGHDSSTLTSGHDNFMRAANTAKLEDHQQLAQTNIPLDSELCIAGVQPKLRKKTSTYMSPTKATSQRAIATLGAESPKLASLRVKGPALNMNVSQANGLSDEGTTKGTSPAAGSGSFKENDKVNPIIASPTSPRTRRQLKPTAFQRRSPLKTPLTVDTKAGQAYQPKSPKSPTSPSKIPRPSHLTSGRSSGSTSAATIERQPIAIEGGLPVVANTTTRRRTSHADILLPILNRLDNQGLRKGSLPPSFSSPGERNDGAPVGIAINNVREALCSTSHAAMAQQSRRSSTSTGTCSTYIAIAPSSLMPLQTVQPSQNRAAGLSAPTASPSVTETPQLNGGCAKVSQTPTLRATAKEFKPLWKAETPVQQLGILDWEGALDAYPGEEWAKLPPNVRKSIQVIEEWKDFGELTGNGAHRRTGSPSKSAQRRFWGSLMTEPGSQSRGSMVTSGNHVQTGQVLRPIMSPDTGHLQWTMLDVDGQEKPIHFGRAADPLSPSQYEEIREMSPASSATMSPQTPTDGMYADSLSRTWAIDALHGPMSRSSPYGWRGGDGKEISFSGYGPHAEKNPNVMVGMGFGGHRRHFDRMESEAQDDKENIPKFWPRSRRQWAKLAGASMQPCGDMHILSAVEQIPYAPALGLCNDCTTPPFDA